MKYMSKKHPGFAAVQAKIASKEGVSMKSAGAILASSTRKASASAKTKNPRLKKVKGKGMSASQMAENPWAKAY